MRDERDENVEASEPAKGNAALTAVCIVAAIGAALAVALAVAGYLWLQSAAGFIEELPKWKLPL